MHVYICVSYINPPQVKYVALLLLSDSCTMNDFCSLEACQKAIVF